jgi:hypothetical protein
VKIAQRLFPRWADPFEGIEGVLVAVESIEAAEQQGNRAPFACGQHVDARRVGIDAAGKLNQSCA